MVTKSFAKRPIPAIMINLRDSVIYIQIRVRRRREQANLRYYRTHERKDYFLPAYPAENIPRIVI